MTFFVCNKFKLKKNCRKKLILLIPEIIKFYANITCMDAGEVIQFPNLIFKTIIQGLKALIIFCFNLVECTRYVIKKKCISQFKLITN